MNSFSFIFLLFYLTQIPSVFSYYNATESIFFSCGASESSVSPDGRDWIPDSRSKFGPFDGSDPNSVAAKALKQGTSTVSVPYMSARISRSQFTYSFPLTSGQKFIRLYFHPTDYEGGFAKFKDWIDVKVGPFTFLRNFSASLFAQDWDEDTFFREFSVNVGEQQSLNITFAPFPNSSNDSYAFINGIEIVPMPSNLYYTPPGNNRGIKLVGENRTLRVENSTALGTACRLNVGGSFIRPEDDTGMLRSWNDDSTFRDVTNHSILWPTPDANLSYSKIQPFVAPDAVYLTSRYIDTDTTDKLVWDVFVYPGYMYLVRLHFCQQSDELAVNDNRFDVLIDNKMAESGFDVVEAAGGSFIPIYRDYLVIAGKKGETKDYQLNVTIHNKSCPYPTGFLNGMEIIRLNDSDGSLAGPNPNGTLSPEPTLAPPQPIPPAKSNRILLIVVIGGSVVGLLALLSMFCLFFIWRRKKGKKNDSYSRLFSCCGRLSSKGQSSRSKSSLLPHELCRNFSLDEIRAATNNFDSGLIIGKGGFGPVYKGEIDGGATIVAIKRLNQDSHQGISEFKTEIELLSKLRHVHLVSLIGYCMDEGEMILVYEYMPKGTLREHLYGGSNDLLSWKQRLEICIGAARGLDYLHTGTAHMIIHRDIKTTNILLDENLTAKVSDFGLSRICVNNTAVSTLVKGTVGYMDPEYARLNHLTEKSDVYSFGVVLFEVLCARKAVNNKLEDEQRNLALWAKNCIEKERIYEIIDPYLMGKISPDCFNKFVEIAESCTRNNGTKRPSMHDVKEKLEFALELQEAADAETEKKGIEPVYPEVSFCAPRYTNFVSGSIEEIEFTTSDTSYYGLNSSSGFESRIVTSTRSASTDVTESTTTL